MRVYETVVRPASAGFGEYQVGEYCEVEGVETIEEWLELVEANGGTAAPAPELNGKVHGQNGADLFRIVWSYYNGDERHTSYCAIWIDASA